MTTAIKPLAYIYAGTIHCTSCAKKDLAARPDMGRIKVQPTEQWWSQFIRGRQTLDCAGCYTAIADKTLGSMAEYDYHNEDEEPECEHESIRHENEGESERLSIYCNECDEFLGRESRYFDIDDCSCDTCYSLQSERNDAEAQRLADEAQEAESEPAQ